MNILERMTNEYQIEVYLKYKSLSPPFEIIGFANKLGLEIKESAELSEKISGFIKQTADGKIFICVNKKHHPTRKRFTIAHELGHYFLHREKLSEGIVDSMLNREDGSTDNIEYQANEFGAELLMPEDMFKQLWAKENCSISNMSCIFLVSESAIVTRAKFLKLAPEDYGYFV